MFATIRTFARARDGITSIEMAVLSAVVTVVLLGAGPMVGDHLSNPLEQVQAAMAGKVGTKASVSGLQMVKDDDGPIFRVR
jgi:Flp pilus assembly pilin Flp